MGAHGGPRVLLNNTRNDLVFYFDHKKSWRKGKDLINNNPATKQNGVSTGIVGGKRCISFDGVDDRILFDPVTLTDAWTIMYWFYHDSSTGSDMILGEYNTGPNRFYHRDTGTAYKIRVHNDAYENIQDFTIGDQRQKWTHIAYAKDASRVYGWLNGELTMDLANTSQVTFVLDSIGLPYTATSYHWLGGIDFVHAYNRVLTDRQVLRLYRKHRKYFQV